MAENPPVCEAFMAVVLLAQKDGVRDASQLPGCWERKIGQEWWIALNAHKKPVEARSPGGASASEGFPVEPYHCYIEFNGWPAGDISPHGGTIASGEAANEAAFIAAVEAEIARAP